MRRSNFLAEDTENRIESAINTFSTLYSGYSEDYFSKEPIIFSENESSSVKLQFEAKKEDNVSGHAYQPKTNAITIDQDGGAYTATHDFATLSQRKRTTLQARHKYVYGIMDTVMMSPAKMASVHDRIVHENLQNELIQALKIIEPRITDLDFLQEPFAKSNLRFAYVQIEGYEKRIKLSNMGEGVNRILAIILTMLNCKDGIFLLDEFDNGLHYSVQGKLWKIVFALAEQHNIQVFATTHSNDCVRSFARIAKNKAGKLIRLQSIDNNIKAISYDEQDVLECIASTDIEAR